MGFVGRDRVELDDLPGCQGVRVGFPFDRFHGIGDERLDLEQPIRVDGAAELVADLETVIGARVVRGGDVDRAAGLFIHHREGDDRGGGGSIRQVDFQPVAGQHLGHGRGKILAVEAFVVTHHHPLALPAFFEQVIGEALGAAADIVEGVVLGDDAAPAIRTKSNFEGHRVTPEIR